MKTLTAAQFSEILRAMPEDAGATAFRMAEENMKAMNGEVPVDVAFMAAVHQLAQTIADITGGQRDIRFLCSIAAALVLQGALGYDRQDAAHFGAAAPRADAPAGGGSAA